MEQDSAGRLYSSRIQQEHERRQANRSNLFQTDKHSNDVPNEETPDSNRYGIMENSAQGTHREHNREVSLINHDKIRVERNQSVPHEVRHSNQSQLSSGAGKYQSIVNSTENTGRRVQLSSNLGVSPSPVVTIECNIIPEHKSKMKRSQIQTFFLLVSTVVHIRALSEPLGSFLSSHATCLSKRFNRQAP